MKIKPKKMAVLLLELTRDKDEKEAVGVIKDFLAWTAKRKKIRQADQIAAHFAALRVAEAGIAEAELATAREADDELIGGTADFIKERTGASQAVIKTTIDPDIIGGAVLRWQDKVLDGSFRTRIKDLEKAMKR